MQPTELPPLPPKFPKLPVKADESAWSAQLEHAVALIQASYHNAYFALQQEADPVRLRIVLHGFIDGWCRTVAGLKASTDNTAETVLGVFLAAIALYGVPSRVRGDRGGENIQVSIWMIL
ncbi:hypothetical protein HGRIS_012334 [Hohenbuehelia grisea]|uniref:Integrase core domain-containing protein n=1 Tax=Hohenbuehelia grisea TaxID=104357 RepID=A0ABR3IS42_9AGAR